MSAAAILASCGHKAELESGVNLSNLDTTVNPVEDFYQYACGGWMAANPLKAEYSRYGSFDKLADDNREQLKSLIDSIAGAKNAKGSVAEKIAVLYNQGMDSATLQKQGAEPIQPVLNEIAGVKTREDVYNELINLHKTATGTFFGVYCEADYTNSAMQLGWIYQGGIGMGERDYYLKAENKEIRDAYVTLMTTEFALAGYDKLSGISADKLAQMVLNLETRLAKAQYDNLTQRDPEKNFHKVNFADADKMAKGVDFARYFAAVGLKDVKEFNLAQPEYMAEVGKVLTSENIDVIKAYYAWCVINEAANYLSDDFVNANFDFFGKALSGKESNEARWKRVTRTLNGTMSEAIGQMYVAKYFPPEAKERMTTLVNNLMEAFGQRIDGAQWMDQTTKDKAHEKLDAILVKIGYPDKWRDYGALEIKNDSYYANVVRASIFENNYQLSKIGKPTDRTEWLMPPQTVNAYYNPTTNEICFPAAILQPPFFNLKADDAVNYGAIGVVIGHEMTHGFDDQGRLYDKDGNLNTWWNDKDAENFKNNAQVLVDHFNGIKVLDTPETYANGEYTLGENIADNGGLHISYLAMQNAIAKGQVKADKMDGFTAAQRFFLAYAGVWAGNIREKEIQRLTTSDVHSLGRWRVNGTLPHIAEFVDAWGVKEGNAMWLAPEKRVTLW